jgi:hypothetical protein
MRHQLRLVRARAQAAGAGDPGGTAGLISNVFGLQPTAAKDF